jgi:hypothetical protein
MFSETFAYHYPIAKAASEKMGTVVCHVEPTNLVFIEEL